MYFIIILIIAGISAFVGFRTLRNSAKYRFSQTRLNVAGIVYLGAAIVAVVTRSIWPLLISGAVYFFLQHKYGNAENL